MVVNPPEGHQSTTSLAHAKRYVAKGLAEFVKGSNAIRFRDIPVQKHVRIGPPVNALKPRAATVTWPAQFTDLFADYRPDLPGDPSYLTHFLPQGGIGLDQRSSKGKAA